MVVKTWRCDLTIVVSENCNLKTNERSDAEGAARTIGARKTGPTLESHYRFVLWLVLTAERFPRGQ